MKKKLPLLIVLLFLMMSCPQAQTVNNGSVTAAFASNSGIGAGNAASWSVCSFSPDICDPGQASYVAGSQVTATYSPDGGTWLGLAAMSPAGATECASTTISGLTVGQLYTLYLCAACFGTGTSICNNSPATPTIRVGTTSQQYTIPMVGSTWMPLSLTFTATAATMPLEANNSSVLGAYYAYVGLDGFSLTTPCGILLPIKLLSFNAFAQENYTVKINWETMEELDSDHFVLERSEDGAYFYPIHRVDAAGNSNSLLTYNFIDDELPVKNGVKGGDFYYRLKQVDINNEGHYSDIRVVSFISEKVNLLKVYPNPTASILNVDFILGEGEDTPFYKVINSIGKVVLDGDIDGHEGFNTTQVDVKTLAGGTYVLQFKMTSGSFQRKFVKK